MLRKKGSQRQYRTLAVKANVEFEMQIKQISSIAEEMLRFTQKYI